MAQVSWIHLALREEPSGTTGFLSFSLPLSSPDILSVPDLSLPHSCRKDAMAEIVGVYLASTFDVTPAREKLLYQVYGGPKGHFFAF